MIQFVRWPSGRRWLEVRIFGFLMAFGYLPGRHRLVIGSRSYGNQYGRWMRYR